MNIIEMMKFIFKKIVFINHIKMNTIDILYEIVNENQNVQLFCRTQAIFS